jgi:hypothetical protein
MNYYNFFEFLKDKEGKEIPLNVQARFNGLNLTPYLHDNMTIEGGLDLFEIPIKELPKNLIVKGDLNLLTTEISFIPDNTKIEGSLVAANMKSPEFKLGNNITIGGYVQLHDSKIYSLPNNLTVGGNLGASFTPIKTIGKNIKVKEDLLLHNTNLESLPKDLKVGARLTIVNTPFLETLRDKYPTLSDDEIRQKLKSVFPGVNYIQLD